VASLVVEGNELVVTLSAVEKFGAFRGNVRVPLSAVKSVVVEPDPWSALRGMRAPGTGMPGVVAYGVRRLPGVCRDFAALTGRGPAVRVDLTQDSPFGRLLVSVADPEATVTSVQQALTAGPAV
jgi:hypothetical protein